MFRPVRMGSSADVQHLYISTSESGSDQPRIPSLWCSSHQRSHSLRKPRYGSIDPTDTGEQQREALARESMTKIIVNGVCERGRIQEDAYGQRYDPREFLGTIRHLKYYRSSSEKEKEDIGPTSASTPPRRLHEYLPLTPLTTRSSRFDPLTCHAVGSTCPMSNLRCPAFLPRSTSIEE